MECDQTTHPKAIRLLRLMVAQGWHVEIVKVEPPATVTATRGNDRREANGESLLVAMCELADACGIDHSAAA